MASALVTFYTTHYSTSSGTAFSGFMIAEHRTQNASKNRSRHRAFSGFSSHIHMSGIAFAIAEIIVVGIQIDPLSINNNLLGCTIAAIAIGASTSDNND